jgi:hypothetical protein
MSDLLSAASLLLAIVAVLHGMWYPEIVRSLDTHVPDHPAAKRKPYAEVSDVRRTRALPLMTATVLLAAVFLPDAVKIVLASASTMASTGVSALARYSAVATAFVLVEFLALCFAAYFTRTCLRFRALLERLSPEPAGKYRGPA